ncbi:type II toxin-antitoxin system toxin DNA ADP-ribosyl transferase DarT [Bacillus sp. FJAT-29937]|uniref:type II toxin-antitoxin system toxin DNA ADP-ribosyl transferase DarT n=1 Tax=Bacillus sp. FJAT-29937 TaxID=1720553 RepID=UPI00082BF846|nr:DarT ssDNA thymidine ADP-ribosyltransferase family protein [Bacillus sp. FJAT-29937]
MKIPQKYKGRYFYHFTHIDNIESIVKHGLLSTNEKERISVEHVDLANEDIQLRRSQMDVPCEPYGKIHDYVPFYFATVNPMLLGVLNRKNIDQPLVVFIAISIEKLLNGNVVFTDASANTLVHPNFYSNPEDLDNLKWDLIDSNKWNRGTDNELHSRMAEVLIHKKVPIEWIDSYVVFNNICKKEIKKVYEDYGLQTPTISHQPFNDRYFFFTKFFMKDRERETLVTGPIFLRNEFKEVIKNIKEKRKNEESKQSAFQDINDALLKIKKDFCILKELEDIFELETDNKVHSDNVSDHTLQVVSNLEDNKYYRSLSESDKKLVKLSAYLHDIGKGPKSKWKKGIQAAYPDHPADSIPMLERILVEEFKTMSKYEIRKICLLVIYHDIIGDILANGRSEKELLSLKIDENELNMLIAISIADISAITPFWTRNIEVKLPSFIKKISKEILNDKIRIR